MTDQTVRFINKGLTPDELVQAVMLPQYLRDHPWLQERYGRLRGLLGGFIPRLSVGIQATLPGSTLSHLKREEIKLFSQIGGTDGLFL